MPNNTSHDAAALLEQSNADATYIYRIYFDIVIASADESEHTIKISDSFDVLGGQDAREAQTKVQEFVMSSGKYPAEPVEFYITGSKRLAGTDI